jgi:hypothetical protein
LDHLEPNLRSLIRPEKARKLARIYLLSTVMTLC